VTPPATAAIDLAAARRFPVPGRRRWPATTAAAACVAMLVVVAVLTRGRPPAAVPEGTVTGDPAAVLRAAAAATERSADPRPAPGQARLVTTRQFTLEVSPGDGEPEVVGLDQLVEEWIPADPGQPWMQRIQDARPPQIWDAETRTYLPGVPAPTTESHGRCGDYFPVPGQDPCGRPGLWQEPTEAFVAGLPADPRALLARLRADAAGGGTDPGPEDPGPEMLVFAAQALERGLLPAPVRATVYRALALLPGLSILEGTRALDGRTGVAVGLPARGARVEIVVDPGTGAYVGRCRVLVTSRDGLPPGTVTDATSLHTGIVSAVGQRR
jgi:hypothetical protein